MFSTSYKLRDRTYRKQPGNKVKKLKNELELTPFTVFMKLVVHKVKPNIFLEPRADSIFGLTLACTAISKRL
jgi:hypothetical protein